MFKVRIKEYLRLYLSRKAARWLFDHRITLYANRKDCIGVCNESADFLDASMVPEPVAAVRDRTHFTEIEGGWIGECAIRYRKHVKFYPVRSADIYDRASIQDVNDLMRFSVEEFVRYLGPVANPVRSLVCDQVCLIHSDCVHHVNMILRYVVNGRDAFRRYRIVLNREGIRRIESVPKR